MMRIEIKLDCTYKNTAPVCQFSSTKNIITKTLTQKNDVVLNFDIEKHDMLKIDFINNISWVFYSKIQSRMV